MDPLVGHGLDEQSKFPSVKAFIFWGGTFLLESD